MTSPLDATVLLCDAAVADMSGKMHMLGAGWSVTSSPTAPAAVVVLLKVPWDRANTKLRIALTLVDADGRPVVIEDQTVGIERFLEVGRPPGLEHGVPIDTSFTLSVGPMPLVPGRYRWLLDAAGQQFSAGFTVMAPGA